MAGEHGPGEEERRGCSAWGGRTWVPTGCRSGQPFGAAASALGAILGELCATRLLCCTHTPRCDSGGERFLLSFRGPSKPATSVADLGGGVYGFAYASAVSGPYVMSLTLHGVHLPGSPFTVTLREHAT